MSTPTYVSSSSAAKTITVQWERPTDNGGCAILGYRLYRSAGSNDQFDQGDLDTLVPGLDDNDPSITQLTVDLSSSGTVGYLYKFKVQARN